MSPFLRTRGSTALLLAMAALAPSSVLAQGAVSAPAVKAWSIPAGSLGETLLQIGQRSGRVIAAAPELVRGLRAPAISADMSVEQALTTALAGSGLAWFTTENGTYSLRRAPEGATTLPQVNVVDRHIDSGVTEGSGSLTTAGPVAAATGLGLTLRDTPQSVTVVTRERIEQQNLTTLAEVAEQVTGVFYTSKGTPIGGRTLMYARGFEVDSYQIDGVNVPWEALAESERYGHGSLDTAIYDSITVVRGSTGLMTGAGDPSALMALTRKKPTRERQTLVEVAAGSWDHYRFMADAGGPLNASGSVRGRVVGAYDESETWVDNYSNERSIIYGVLEADVGPRTLLTLTLERGTANSKGAPWAEDYGLYPYFEDGVTPIPPSTTTSIAPHWAYLDSDRTYVSATLEHEFNADWKARFSYGFGRFNSDMRRGMVNVIPGDGTPTRARVLALDYSYDTHIIDARVDGKYRLLGREHELVAGLNMYRNDQAAPLGYYGVISGLASWNNGRLRYADPDWSTLPDSSGDYPYDIETRQDGAYLATRLRPLDRLSVILGGRVTNWQYFYADRATPDHGYSVYSDLEYRNEFTPYAGVVLDIDDSLSAYASYTQIFKPQEVRDVSGNLLDPEEGTTYEAGLKGAWLEGRLNASIAVFESKRDNLAVEDGTNLTPKFDQAYRAEDHTKGRGWELEVAGALTPRWQVQAGYTHFKNRDSSGDILDTTQPVQQFKLYTAYEPALVPGLSLGASVRWQDDTAADPLYASGNRAFDKVDSHVVLGMHADYALSRNLSLALALNNVLDEEYRVSTYTHSYGAPRNATVTLRAKF